MRITMEYDLDNQADREIWDRVATLIDPIDVIPAPVSTLEIPPAGLAAVCRALVTPKGSQAYGETRLGYLRMLAVAGTEGRTFGDLMAHFAACATPATASQSFGGVHSNVEASWRSNGGEKWTAKFITDTPDGRQVMYAPACPILVHLLVGEPDDDE